MVMPHTSDAHVGPHAGFVPGPVSAGPAPHTPFGGISGQADRMRDALRHWLDWNQAYEQLTARMFQASADPERLEALAEQVDRLRRRAVAASRQAVG